MRDNAHPVSDTEKLHHVKRYPQSLLELRAGNVTVRVDIASPNASEIHEVIAALEKRLKVGPNPQLEAGTPTRDRRVF